MEEIIVVAVPFPAQGHLNPLLQFSLLLSSHHNLPVHFAASAVHNRQAKTRIQGWNSTSLTSIHFHDLPIPPFPNPPPNPNSLFPTHLLPSFNVVFTNIQPPLSSLLRSLSASCRRLVVVHDSAMPFAHREAAAIPNAESYAFQIHPAFHEVCIFWPHHEDVDHNLKKRAPSRRALDVILTQLDDAFDYADIPDDFKQVTGEGAIFNSFRSMEGEFLDLLSEIPDYNGKRLFAVGPLNPVTVERGGGRRHECLEWLDRQPTESVIYVSFGSTVTLSDEQIEQLAIGLKSSGQRFIWVLRDADRGDIFSSNDSDRARQLPSGFEEEVKDVGMVVRGWVPQLEILAHPSTGGFVSHCGWNSVTESLSFGVAMIAWPMHSDQPRNAKVVTDYLRAGVAVREWARRREVVTAEEIEKVIRTVMVEDEGKEIRVRAKVIGEEARIAREKGGSSTAELESFVAHISR